MQSTFYSNIVKINTNTDKSPVLCIQISVIRPSKLEESITVFERFDGFLDNEIL